MQDSHNRKVAVGIAWMTAARAIARALGLVSTVVLARLLVPEDFGLIAMAMAVAAGFELLTLFSFETALIRESKITRAHYDSAWTLNVLMGLAIAVALAASAIPFAAFYREPRLEAVMLIIGIKYFIDGLGNTGTVDFRRQMAFDRDFLMQVVPKIAGILVTIPLAIWLRDYRALLSGMLTSSSVGCMMSYLMHPHRPRPCLTEASGLFRFSRWLLLNGIVSFVRVRSADFIIGRQLGPQSLGIFSVAFEVSNLPSTEMVAPINRVLFPSYVGLAGDPDGLRESFCATLGLIALLILPASVGLAAVAEPLVRLALGEKWLESIPLVTLLALAGASNVLQTNTGSVYNAIGRPRLIALTSAIHAATLIPMLLYGTHVFGLKGAAWAILVHSVGIGLPATYLIFFSHTSIRPAEVWRVCWRPVAACAVMFLAVDQFLRYIEPTSQGTLPTLVGLIVACLTGLLCYALTVTMLWLAAGRPHGAEKALLVQIAGRWQRMLKN